MARIETHGAIQLTLPESSRVFVFAQTTQNRERQSPIAVSEEPDLFDQALIEAIVQDRQDLGSDGMDANGHLARFEDQLTELAAQSVPFERIVSDIDRALKEIPLEGKAMGSRHPILREIKSLLIGMSEEIMTQPDPTRP